ncbi:MAG: amidase [Actinomycetota bacterium]
MAVATAALPITESSARQLAEAIAAREVAAREVVETHIELLERSGTNAIAADRYEQAREEADAADARIEAGESDLPPLLGVPCTIKESIRVRGMPNCAGLVCRRDFRSEETAPAAQRLIDAGAIPLGVSNVSELTMWLESDNRVYGRTNNAYDRKRIAGGSSGGEGAAIGSGGSPIGLGSDIAGSIRMPAFFNGVFGHKPSPDIVPDTGMFPSTGGEAARLLTMGPLSRRAEDLMPLIRIIAGPDGQDQRTRDVELGDPDEVSLDGLDVILSEHASFLPTKRELREARERAAGALAAAGARVRREDMKELRRALELFLVALQDGADVSVRDIIVNEGGTPPTLRTAFRRGGPYTIPTLLLLAAERIGERMPEIQTRRALAAARSVSEQVTGVIGGGVLLHPSHARVAPRHSTTIGQTWLITPTAAFNLLGLPVTQVPLGLNAKGLPLGVQVAAGPDRDHVTIAVALELERVFGGWVPPWRA